MRATAGFGGYAVALVAILIRGAWTLEIDDARRIVIGRMDLQSDPTSQVALTVAYPKITPAPLVRRKLGSTKWDIIHEGIQAQKRDGETCAESYQLCPKSLNGGCCPNDRICGESSCLPKTAAPAAGCGRTNYFACDIQDGGGCCPTGYVCSRQGCFPSVGVTHSETCGLNSYLCPASLNYGCCKVGMGCALESCYSTEVVSFTLTQTITTTDANSDLRTFTQTIVSATTPVAPTARVTSDANAVPKVDPPPTAIPKSEASGSPSQSGGGGLTGAQIGGIIAGAVGLLVAVIIAACMIMRRLNTAIRISDANTRSRTESSEPLEYPRKPRPMDVDAMSVDPLMMTPSEVSETIKLPSNASVTHSETHEADSSPVFRSPFSPLSPAFMGYRPGYNAVASSESQYSTSFTGHDRNDSADSTPPMGQMTPGGYFDIPPRSTDHNSPTSRVSPSSQTRRPSQHGRNWSNASDQSAVSQASSTMAELEAGLDGDRRSSLQRALQGLGLGRVVSRRRSSPARHSNYPQTPTLTGGPVRSEFPSPPVLDPPGGAGRGVLGHIPEAGESRLAVDGNGDEHAGLSNAQLRHLSLQGGIVETIHTRTGDLS